MTWMKKRNILALLLFVVIFTVLLFILGSNTNTTDNNVQEENNTQVVTPSLDKPAFNLNEENAKSRTCESIALKPINKATGASFSEKIPSIANATTSEGRVSGCTLQTPELEGQAKESILIIARVFNKTQEALDTFTRLTTDYSEITRSDDYSSFASEELRQILILFDNTLVTININQASISSDQASEISQKIFENLSK